MTPQALPSGAMQGMEADRRGLVRVHLLGGFRVEVDGTTLPDVAWSRQSAKTLLKLLALESTHRLHREQILDMLWPDADPDAAANAFRKALHGARQALEPRGRRHGASSYLRLQDDLLVLDPETVWIDVDAFEQAAASALRGGDPAEIDEALRIYGGELLPGDRYEEWTASRREQLFALWTRMMRARARAFAQSGQPEAAAGILQELLVLDPTQEDVHRGLMRLYLSMGSKHAAMRQYQQCREALLVELGVEPDEETQALYAEIARPPSAESAPRAALPSFLRRAPPTPLVGRQRVADALLQALDQARVGSGSALLLAGEAGIGKSRLAADLAREASRRDTAVLWGSAYAQESAPPYGLFVDALHGYYAARPESERQQLARDHPELASLIPGVAREHAVPDAVWEAAYPEREMEGGRLAASVLDVLSGIAGRKSLLLVLDDVHGADGTSLRLLEVLLRETPRRPWLICATYRLGDMEQGSEFHRLVTRATREGLCRVVNLLRLSREDADALAGEMLPGAAVDEALLDHLWSLSLGNPLFLGELVRVMRAEGEIEARDGIWWLVGREQTRVPEQVQELVVARVYGMGDEARRVLTTAAVAGMEVSFPTLRAATAMDDLRLLDVLDRALQSWVLEERDKRYAFRHPLVRSALYESLSVHRRRHIHGAIGGILEREHPDDVDALAYHFARSGDEDKAVIYLERAGDRARAVHANETAGESYRELIPRLEALARPEDVVRVRRKLAEVLALTGSYTAALDQLETVLRHYRETGDPRGMTRALALAGRIHWVHGSHAIGLKQIESLLPLLDDRSPSVEEADLCMTLAHLYFAENRMRESLEAAERADDLAQALGNRRLLAEAEMRRATDLWMLTTDPTRPDHEQNRVTYDTSREEILAMLRDAAALAEENEDLQTQITALHNLAVFLEDLGDLESAARTQRKLMEIDERIGNVAWLARHMAALADLLVLQGDWRDARVLIERSVELTRESDSSWQSAYPMISLAWLDLLEGKRTEMEAHLREAAERGKRDDNRHALRLVVQLEAERDLEDGRAAEARRHLKQAIRPLRDEEVPELMDTLALAYAETGDAARAEELMAFAIAGWKAQGLKRELLEHLVVQGQVLLKAGKRAEAVRAAVRAEELAGELAIPYRRAQALYLRGLASGPQSGTGRRALQEALQIFRTLGALPTEQRVLSALASE